MHLGLGRFESVSILGFNSPEWHLSNMGAIAAGGFAAGIYTTNEPDACKYILKHSNARIVVVDGQKQLDKILKIRGDLPKLVAIVVWGEELPAGVNDGIGVTAQVERVLEAGIPMLFYNGRTFEFHPIHSQTCTP